MSVKTKVLYIDDEIVNLELFQVLFSDKYQVAIAASGMDGLTILQNNPDIRLVVCDLKMPKMNGLEFIRLAKPQYPEIVFMLLTGYELTDEIQMMINSKHIAKYIRKPYRKGEIEAVFGSYIS